MPAIISPLPKSSQFWKTRTRTDSIDSLPAVLTSKGDDAIISNGHLDAAREWYAEALNVYDGDRSGRRSGDEQDAVNALVRFLHSRLGRHRIPMPPHTPSIDETMSEVIGYSDDSKKIFDDIAYLVFHSTYAASRLLSRLYSQQDLRGKALQYLKTAGVQTLSPSLSQLDFTSLWNSSTKKHAEGMRKINADLRLLSKFQLTTAWLESAIEQCKETVPRLKFDLDQERVRYLQETLEHAVELCRQDRFEVQERLCHRIDDSCRDLLLDIENSPTRISVEVLYPIIENIQRKISEYIKDLYVTAKPELTLNMPVEDYSGHEANIEIEIAVENKLGCSPAEGLEIIVNKDDTFFMLTQPEITLNESLLGGSSCNITVPLQLTDHALRSEAFSLSAYARYRTSSSSGITEETAVENFTIRLYPADAFEDIVNPYNEGPVVSNPDMFYGRDRMIENVVDSIQDFHAQTKCVVIYGQKRAGKTSILYHLQKSLEHRNFMILDLGNIGGYLDKDSHIPFSHQILRLILTLLENAIEDRVDDGFSTLDISFPSEKDFYEHPTPMILFKEVFDNYGRRASELTDWQGVQLVLVIDEFSYIYGHILSGYIPKSFMQNWKALMQANYFNAVLVGQDIMERFIETFPNEFGIAQRERVTYLDKEDAVKLIEDPIRIENRHGESRYRESRAIDRIFELTAGSPFYIQMFCNRLVELMNVNRAMYVTYSYVERVKNRLMEDRNALRLGSFDNLYNSGEDNKSKDKDVLKILYAIAENSQTGLCKREHIRCETELPIDNLLDELVERDVIDRTRGDYYNIKVGLFKEWLIANESGEV